MATAFKLSLRHLDTFQLPAYASLFVIAVVLNEPIVPATFTGLVLILTGTLVQQLPRRNG